jgi:Carbohydrate family 9 binding domain-like
MSTNPNAAAVRTQAIAAFVSSDSGPDLNPRSRFWSGASRIAAEADFHGQPIPDHRTEVLFQWTVANFYVLFVCPYRQLHLKPNPDLAAETYELWNWDVAEVFIGEDFTNIRRYKEFEVSPQGEWVDLDVNLDNPPHETGWVWQSGIQVASRIDAPRSTWYGFMRIPWRSISSQQPTPGSQFRINFYRCQGSGPDRKYIAWQPPHRPSFHTPECFGTLTLAAP